MTIVREALGETVRFPVTPAVTGRSVAGRNDGKSWIPEWIPGGLVSASYLTKLNIRAGAWAWLDVDKC